MTPWSMTRMRSHSLSSAARAHGLKCLHIGQNTSRIAPNFSMSCGPGLHRSQELVSDKDACFLAAWRSRCREDDAADRTRSQRGWHLCWHRGCVPLLPSTFCRICMSRQAPPLPPAPPEADATGMLFCIKILHNSSCPKSATSA